jgi:formiminotetrahydrofolate cyclodeaminase
MPLPDSLWSLSLAAFRDALAADRPTPSCGGAAAVSASLGLSLVLMALRISQRHQAQPAQAPLIARGQALLDRLARHADADASAFQGYVAARRDEAAEPEQALRDATAVPLAAAHACRDALDLAWEARAVTRPSLLCDIEAGALLVRAALSALLLNVEVDGEQLGAEQRAALAGDRQRLEQEADRLLARLRAPR